MAIQYPPAEAGPSSPRPAPAPSYRLAHSLSGHLRGVTSLKYTSDGKTLVSAGADGYLHFWDSTRGTHLRSLKAHSTGINDISLSPDDLYVSTASDDNTVRIFPISPLPSSTSSTTPLRTLEGHTAPVLAVAFSPKSNLIVTGSFDESAIVWDVQRSEALRVLPAHADAIWTVGWDPEGVMVLTGSADGLMYVSSPAAFAPRMKEGRGAESRRLWDANSGQCLKTLDNETNSPVSFATFTPSSFFLLSSTLSSTLRVYNIHTGKVLKTLRAPAYKSEKYPSPAVVFARLTTASAALVNGGGAEMDANGSPAVVESEGEGAGRRGEAWVVAGSESGHVVIWDINSRGVVATLEGHKSPVVAVAVHPSGRWIATGSLEPEKVIHIWQAAPSLPAPPPTASGPAPAETAEGTGDDIVVDA